MYLFILKSVLGSIVGSSFYSWWQNTKLGIWFQMKLNELKKIIRTTIKSEVRKAIREELTEIMLGKEEKKTS